MLFATILAVVSSGCSRGPSLPEPVSISGKLTLKGKPVDGATISFSAISEGLPGNRRYAEGKTDANGEYSIPDVSPAEYMVQIFKADPSAAPSNPDQVIANPAANSPFAAYGNESPLRAIVKSDSTHFDFELDGKK